MMVKNCPFCGSADIKVRISNHGDHEVRAQCYCGAEGEPFTFYHYSDYKKAVEQAIEAWNKRTPPPEPEQKVKS